MSVIGHLPTELSEETFKLGIQTIIGETGTFKDWGGERNDLLTTRVGYKRKRRATAFAFKGPAVRGILPPARLGKNGDQIQKLFHSPADFFFVQHWREVSQAVREQLRVWATAKSAHSGRDVWFGVIDGADLQTDLRRVSSSARPSE